MFCADTCGKLCGTMQIFRTGAAELPHRRTQIFRAGERRSSVRIRVENGGNQKANFVHNNRLKDRETRRKDRSNIYALGYLCLTLAEFCTESANCSARNPLIVRADNQRIPRGHLEDSARTEDIRGRPRGYMRIIRTVVCSRLRKKLSFPCHALYFGGFDQKCICR